MNLPHLSQTIQLERGEAFDLYEVIGRHWQHHVGPLCNTGPPVPAECLLALPVLEKVGKRLYRIDQREKSHVGKPRTKPTAFKLSYQEVVALMLHLVPHAAGFSRVPLGKVQQVSLNLAHVIKFG
jgi:hypothetical protein